MNQADIVEAKHLSDLILRELYHKDTCPYIAAYALFSAWAEIADFIEIPRSQIEEIIEVAFKRTEPDRLTENNKRRKVKKKS